MIASKIGPLPEIVLQELNRRLQMGENAAQLVEWLNALPEAQAVSAGSENRPGMGTSN